MSPERSRVLVALRVPCQPAEAWERFTAEIGQWWPPNPLFAFSQGRSGTLAFEPGVGGRLTKTYADGSVFVIGMISVWEPPRRLVVSWRQASFPPEVTTELHVHFEPTRPEETRLSVEHYGWDSLPAEHASRHGFPLPAFQLRSPSGGARSSPTRSPRLAAVQPERSSSDQRRQEIWSTLRFEGRSSAIGRASRERKRHILS